MSCAHHWLIDPPNGETSQGRCKLCGETREFRNGEEVKRWTLPPADPQAKADLALRLTGKATSMKRGKLVSHKKVETRLKLETEVDLS